MYKDKRLKNEVLLPFGESEPERDRGEVDFERLDERERLPFLDERLERLPLLLAPGKPERDIERGTERLRLLPEAEREPLQNECKIFRNKNTIIHNLRFKKCYSTFQNTWTKAPHQGTVGKCPTTGQLQRHCRRDFSPLQDVF